MKTIHILYGKFLRNECTPQEAEEVLRWLDTPEGAQHVEGSVRQALQVDELKVLPLDEGESIALWESIQKQIAEDKQGSASQASQSQVHPVVVKRVQYWPYLAAAAVVLLLVVTGNVYWWKQANSTIRVVNDTTHNRTIELPDGSHVILYKGSDLTYAQRWSPDAPRIVQLRGEAYFTVVHTRESTPFSVVAYDSSTVQVLGTQFEFSARDGNVRVILERGKVNLAFPKSRALAKQRLVPGDMVSFDKATSVISKVKIDASLYAFRAKNAIELHQTSLRDIISALSEVYGYSIVVQDRKALQQRFSGALPNDSVESILTGIADLTGLQYRLVGKHVVFYP
ncbi:FecR family protein [Hymenobacter sp. GOD-10R]|uniref:FecR family protein n=1 Tax=Hymenobacter sp. GOD-10R TaxID=3093922 RepID=UPI002D78AB54|nr:FecR domain-containing protein [Hymenobacter sp. GOD-10R]WRQ31107.1 FecR domain-containing protein [Hymenobacter sp. GOD-10R]